MYPHFKFHENLPSSCELCDIIYPLGALHRSNDIFQKQFLCIELLVFVFKGLM